MLNIISNKMKSGEKKGEKMNQDFHYNATYLAARFAGFTKEEGLVIATAAQFVDDCLPDKMKNNPYVSQVATCEDSGKLGEHFIGPAAYKKQDILNRRRIWSYFHFLPGNLEEEVPYNGDREKTALSGEHWTYENGGSDGFRLMCLPNSRMALSMIGDIIEKGKNNQDLLEFIGLRMHVLADTWAHSYFSGTPDQCVNDLNHFDGFKEIVGDEKNIIKFVQIVKDKIDDSPSTHFYGVVLVDSPRFVSPVYVGHGRVGHLPDYAYCKFQYQPLWKSMLNGDDKYHIKNNPENFMNAFRQMVAVMKAIKTGQSHDQIDYDQLLTPQQQTDIAVVIGTRKINIATEWDALTLKYFNETLSVYNMDTWINEYVNLQNSGNPLAQESHYVKFTKAARAHYDWAETIIDEALRLKARPFIYQKNNADIALFSGLLLIKDSLLIYKDNQETTYQSGMLPGIVSIQLLESKDYVTSYLSEKGQEKIFEYVLVIRGGCPKNNSSLILQFVDRSGESYDLSIISSDVKNHTVFFNSPYPEIVRITMKINNSTLDTLSYGGSQVVDAVTGTASKVKDAIKNLF